MAHSETFTMMSCGLSSFGYNLGTSHELGGRSWSVGCFGSFDGLVVVWLLWFGVGEFLDLIGEEVHLLLPFFLYSEYDLVCVGCKN